MNIFSRPLAVRRVASSAIDGAGIVCTVKLSGAPDDSSEAPEPGADELEPDIQTCHQRTHREPLERVAVVLVNIDRRMRPLPKQSVSRGGGRIVLLNRHGRERQMDLSRKRGKVEILPDRP